MFRSLLLVSLLAVSACGSTFKTDYDRPAAASTPDWRVRDVQVIVPTSLEVSEQATIFPQADLVWREDPLGDRRAQIAKILDDAATAGASGLRGSRAVVLTLTVSRFHALTKEAEAKLQYSGVHNIIYTAQVTDAATGQVLAGPTLIEDALPALSGADMAAARARGETQKSQIMSHVRRTIAGWLMVGPDPRGSFQRLGG